MEGQCTIRCTIHGNFDVPSASHAMGFTKCPSCIRTEVYQTFISAVRYYKKNYMPIVPLSIAFVLSRVICIRHNNIIIQNTNKLHSNNCNSCIHECLEAYNEEKIYNIDKYLSDEFFKEL
jgi:hypothetical protein